MAYELYAPSPRPPARRRTVIVCPRAAGRHEAEFDAFLLGALAESKVDNPVLRPASRTPSTRRRHRSFSAQDWEDALEGQEPFAGGAAPAEVPFADDGPDTQSHKGDDDDGDDFD